MAHKWPYVFVSVNALIFIKISGKFLFLEPNQPKTMMLNKAEKCQSEIATKRRLCTMTMTELNSKISRKSKLLFAILPTYRLI